MKKQSAVTNTQAAPFALPCSDQLVGAVFIILGTIIIWLAPNLYGQGVLQASWCLSSHPTLITQATTLTAQLLQHCPFCYLGAGLVGAGFSILSFGSTRRHI
jgi:hypothetical protein